MNSEYISVVEAAETLGVEPRTMARWRLRENRDKSWFLPAYPSPDDKRKLLYKFEDLREFAERNPRYRDRIISWYARDTAARSATGSRSAGRSATS